MSIINLIIVLVGVTLNAIGQLFLKSGADQIGVISLKSNLDNIISAAMNLYILAGLICYILSVIVWIIALSRVQVSIAYPMLSFGYVLVTILAWLIFNEPISALKLAALGIIILGIILLANS